MMFALRQSYFRYGGPSGTFAGTGGATAQGAGGFRRGGGLGMRGLGNLSSKGLIKDNFEHVCRCGCSRLMR